MPSDAVNELTRLEWRELGFFYERDDETKEWRIRGSRTGLGKFAQILLDYSANPRRQALSEHDHFGPYMYLKIGTWSEPVIDNRWIAGTPSELKQLSELIGAGLSIAREGDVLRFRDAYAPGCSYELVLEVSESGFDPAVADAALTKR